MALRFETDEEEVYYVEATSNSGVTISKWSGIRQFVGNFYEHVVLRHLIIERSDAMIDKLEVFL
jgi:hypothetical protein